MKSNITIISNRSFKFNDMPFIEYPIHALGKNGKYYNFKKSVTGSVYSRYYQLEHRSTQSVIFDKLIELDYFKLKGIDNRIYKEVPIINTNLINDPNRSYYLLDYFIPDLSLCIELDSDYHNPIKDKLKDLFLSSIDIDVYRVSDLQSDTLSKINKIIDLMLFSEKVQFNKSNDIYKKDIDEYESIINGIKLKEKMERDGDLYFIRPKWRKIIDGILCKYDDKLKYHILNKVPYDLNIDFDVLYSLIPLAVKERRSYNGLSNQLKSLGVTLNIL